MTKGRTAAIRIVVAACRKPRRVAGIIPQDAPRPAWGFACKGLGGTTYRIPQQRFDGDIIIALCIRSDTDGIIEKVRKRKPKNRYQTRRIMSVHDQRLYRYIYDVAAPFFRQHRHDVHEVIFQCESDCLNFTKANGLLNEVVDGDAYKLADIVSWSNTRNMEPRGVSEADLRVVLEERLLKSFG